MFAPDRTIEWEEVVAHGRWEPVFQPIVSLTDGHVFAYEALSRPHDPTGRPVPILHVVEAAHAAGSETRVDEVAIRAIMLRALDMPQGKMLFVNASPVTLMDHADALVPLRTLRGRLVIEITERELVPDERLEEFNQVVRALRGQGILVAMDDCGAGYSGLNRLVRLRPDFAKIDMELVRDVDRDSAKVALVEAFVNFASQAGISVIAEGVETEAERDTLAELGVDLAQGYLIARPEAAFVPVDPLRVLGGRRSRVRLESHVALAVTLRLANLAVHGLGDQEGFYEATVQAARQATGVDVAVLRRLRGQALVAVARSGPPEAHLDRELRETTRLPVRAVFEGRTLVRQTHAESLQNPSILGSGVAAPVWLGGEIWGVLTMGYRAENQIRADLVQFATGLAAQVALILKASEHKAMGQTRDVLEIIRYFIEHPSDWTDVFSRILRDVEAETDAHDSWIGVVRGGRFELVTSTGEVSSSDLVQWQSPDTLQGRMPPGVALREGRSVVVDDIRSEPSLASERDELLASAIISALAVPIKQHAKVVGVLKVYHSSKGAFTPDRVAYLEDVAQVVAYLIERFGAMEHFLNGALEAGVTPSGARRTTRGQAKPSRARS